MFCGRKIRHMTRVRTPSLVCAAVVLVGCALRNGTPVFTDAVIDAPEPDSVRCGAVAEGLARLEVSVRDASGAIVQGAAVYLASDSYAPGVQQPPPTIQGYTDNRGRVLLDAPGDKLYTVLVTLPGFVPAAAVLHMRGTCSGSLGVVINVASTESLKKLKGAPHK